MTIHHTALTLVGESIRDRWIETPEIRKEICAFSGELTDCVPRKYAVSNGFTQQGYLQEQESQWISVVAYQALKFADQRRKSWFCDGNTFKILESREEILKNVRMKIAEKSWAAYVTTSFKKIGALVAPVNSNGSQLWRFENLNVDCKNKDAVEEMLCRFQKAHDCGIFKGMMKSLSCSAALLPKIGARNWLDFYRWAMHKHNTPLYQFILHLFIPKNEDNNGKLSPV